MKKDIVIYKTLEEAKQKTGYFNVHSIQITKELGNKILEYIQKEKIIVNSRYPKREKKIMSYFTTKFALHEYDRCFYLTWYKSNARYSAYGNKPSEVDINTPTINEMYFFITKKYQDHILKLEYSDSDPNEVPF